MLTTIKKTATAAVVYSSHVQNVYGKGIHSASLFGMNGIFQRKLTKTTSAMCKNVTPLPPPSTPPPPKADHAVIVQGCVFKIKSFPT